MNEVYIKGMYRRCIYQSANGYIVGVFKVSETNSNELCDYLDKSITFTGYFHELNDVDTYIFYGSMVEHDKYGMQFQVTSYDRCKPVEKDAIVEFLTSGLFKGIGEVKAKKIVDVLGKDTLNTIINNPSNLILPLVTSLAKFSIADFASLNLLTSKVVSPNKSSAGIFENF